MKESVLIVGSGPAAVGAALAVTQRRDLDVTVIDMGTRLEETNQSAQTRLATLGPAAWDADDVTLVSALPVGSDVAGLPEKRSLGSDFPFRDIGQRSGVVARNGVNPALISSAYGGFSNVWGAQVTPFTAATFHNWPVTAEDMAPHYTAVLNELPYAAEDDDLSDIFPLLAASASLPQLISTDERSSRTVFA